MSTVMKSSTNELMQQADQWFAANDPARPKPLMALPAGLDRTIALLAEPAGNAASVVSNAQLIGGDMGTALEASRTLKNLINTGSLKDGLEHFMHQPLDGCTSIMNIARTAAGFNPLTPDVKGNVQKFQDYSARILAAPFFNLGYADSKKEKRSSENWDELIDSIVGLFEGIQDQDKTRIKNGLTQLAKAATSHSGTRQEQNLFVQNVLQMDGGTLNVFIYYSSVQLQEDKSKGSTSRQTEFNIARSMLRFRTGDWPYFAEKVWKKQVSVVDDWLDGNNTEPGKLAAKLCIGS